MSSFFAINGPSTTDIYTLSLHDALPISLFQRRREDHVLEAGVLAQRIDADKKIELHVMVRLDAELGDDRRRFLGFFVWVFLDRKSTRLNSSHSQISYAVFCLKKKITTYI